MFVDIGFGPEDFEVVAPLLETAPALHSHNDPTALQSSRGVG
jgi:hypothetical protein